MFRDTLLTGPETHVLRRILVEFLGEPWWNPIPSRNFPKFPCSMPRFSGKMNWEDFVGEMSLWGSMNWGFMRISCARNNCIEKCHVSFQGILRLKGKTYICWGNTTSLQTYCPVLKECCTHLVHFKKILQIQHASWAETWLAIHHPRDEIAWNFIRSEKIPVLPPIFNNSEWSISININTNGQLSMYIHIYSPISTYIHQYSHISTYIHTHRIHVWYIC